MSATVVDTDGFIYDFADFVNSLSVVMFLERVAGLSRGKKHDQRQTINKVIKFDSNL